MINKKPVIAVDGLAATGKGTLARRLAEALDFAYLDTGLLYRIVGACVLAQGGEPSALDQAVPAARALTPEKLQKMAADPVIRSPQGAQAASKVAALQPVRDALLHFQRQFAAAPPHGKKGAVLDGRDIGTVIAPDAMVKIFVTARPEIRARRRFLELQESGESVTETQVFQEMQERDARDTGRLVVPTRPADDAILLDTSDLTIEQVFDKALDVIKIKMGQAVT